MNPLLICLLSAGVFVGSIVGGPRRGPLRFDQWHHQYIGGTACAVGALAHSKLLTKVGAFISLDDATQHLYQRMTNNLDIVSPLNIGYRLTIGTVVPVQRLNRWLDNLMGNKRRS